MFASKNKLIIVSLLIPFGMVICAPYLQAQNQPVAQGSSEQDKPESRTQEWQMDLRLPSAAPAVTPGSGMFVLPDEQQNRKLLQLLSRLAENPGNSTVRTQLNQLLTDVLDQANTLMDTGARDEAGRLMMVIQSIEPGLKGLGAGQERLKTLEQNDEFLKAGKAALAAGNVLQPEKGSALYYFTRVLDKDPRSEEALQGLENIQSLLVDQALEFARGYDFETAEAQLQDAAAVREDQAEIEKARAEIAEIRRERVAELEQKVMDAMSAGNFTLADFSIIDLMALGGEDALVKSLMVRLEEARFYGGFEPGQIILDELASGGNAPEIVVIGAGSFLMGSSDSSDDSYDHEQPQHRVIFRQGFGLGIREVSIADFGVFVKRRGYRTTAENNGYSFIYDEAAGRLSKRAGVYWKHDFRGRQADEDLPVLHISAKDAQAYVQWLSLETGKAYRLPSEAEYEFVARAGGNKTYWWGEGAPEEPVENLTGERDLSSSKRKWTTYFNNYGDGYFGPAPVGSIADGDLVHPMGVHDIAGNVSEWMADCWHDNYVKAPTDGSAWVNPGCGRHVVRGGYWASAPEQSRAAFRFPLKVDSHGSVVGFRIARDL